VLEIVLDHLLLAITLIERHPGNRSQVDVRINQSGYQILSIPGDDGCSRRRLCFLTSLDPCDAPVFDQHDALLDVIEALRGNDGDVGDPNSIGVRIRCGIGNGQGGEQ
jgi:hypothetical protein